MQRTPASPVFLFPSVRGMMPHMKKSYIYMGIGAVVIAILLGWGKIAGTTKPLTFWNDTDIQCLPNGHENLSMHIHQDLTVLVDGVKEEVPANLGVSRECMSEVHTHDATGKLHEESVQVGKKFTLNDVFKVWGKSLDRPGYTATLTVNGAVKPELGAFVLEDHQVIELSYITSGNVQGTSTEAVPVE